MKPRTILAVLLGAIMLFPALITPLPLAKAQESGSSTISQIQVPEITVHFNRTIKERFVVEVRSFPEVVQKSQQMRVPRKKQPILVDVVKLRR